MKRNLAHAGACRPLPNAQWIGTRFSRAKPSQCPLLQADHRENDKPWDKLRPLPIGEADVSEHCTVKPSQPQDEKQQGLNIVEPVSHCIPDSRHKADKEEPPSDYQLRRSPKFSSAASGQLPGKRR